MRARVEQLAQGPARARRVQLRGDVCDGGRARRGQRGGRGRRERDRARGGRGVCARRTGSSIACATFARTRASEGAPRAAKGGFDLVLCDPPKFAPTRGSKDGRARRLPEARGRRRAARRSRAGSCCLARARRGRARATHPRARARRARSERAGDGARAALPGRRSPGAGGVSRGALPEERDRLVEPL